MSTPTNKANERAPRPQLTDTSSQLIATLGEIRALRWRLFELAKKAVEEDKEAEQQNKPSIEEPSDTEEYCVWEEVWTNYIFDRMKTRALCTDYKEI